MRVVITGEGDKEKMLALTKAKLVELGYALEDVHIEFVEHSVLTDEMTQTCIKNTIDYTIDLCAEYNKLYEPIVREKELIRQQRNENRYRAKHFKKL